MTENNGIFRQKSLDRVNSPEQLDAYLKVTNTSVWLILASIILVLVGAIVWSCFGHIETTREAACSIKGGSASCIVVDNDLDTIQSGMSLKINDESYTINNVECDFDNSDVVNNEYNLLITAPCSLKDGVYKGKVVVESISPLKFIFN